MTYFGYDQFNVYYGDLHSHCNQVGYGYGSVEEAYQNARSQLDFASITAHAYWPDIPEDERRLADTVAYHKDGFKRAARAWPTLKEVSETVYEPGRFVSFPSFEWHSRRYGDHNIYYKDAIGEIIRAADLKDMRTQLRRLKEQGTDCLMIPHHIGYLQGYRGISWDDFTPEFSPIVEMFSMHGQAESDDAPYPYMHTMGPRDERSTMQYGLRTGQIFGVVGSTDHHSAFPGSYGYGRAAVWASALTREAIWEAIIARRTYAITGDRILLAFSVNDRPMGSILPNTTEREITVSVVGGGALEFVEVLHNNCPVHRWSAHEQSLHETNGLVKVFVELGWGQKDEITDWQASLNVAGGKLKSVEPRFRGPDIVAPQDEAPPHVAFSSWQQVGDDRIQFDTQTWGNPTILTPATQGVCLEISADERTRLQGYINHCEIDLPLKELKHGARTGHLGGFLSPGYSIHRAVRQSEYTWHGQFQHNHESPVRDWYYVRVCQKNGQWAWSSPIWIDGS